jgi:hypothetical protein
MPWPPKNDFRKGQPIKAVGSDWHNIIANFVRDIEVVGGHMEPPGPDGMGAKIVVEYAPSAGGLVGQVVDFWAYLSGSTEATVTAGLYVIHPGIKKVYVAETTLLLSGDHEWIYVDHDRNTDAVSVVNQDLDSDVGPDPIDTQHLYWMLARYDKQASGAYSLARRTHNGGAIQWGSPL